MLLLKPNFLSFKNTITYQTTGRARNGIINRHSLLIVLAFTFMLILYKGTASFLSTLIKQPEIGHSLPFKLVSFILFAFFLLLFLSNVVSAFGYLFVANDTSFLLSLPISSARFYLKRLIEVIISSLWIFTIFALPTTLAYLSVFQLPWHILIRVGLVCIPFLIIPAALSTIAATIIVPVFRLIRVKEFALIITLVCILTLTIGLPNFSMINSSHQQSMQDLTLFLIRLQDPHPIWMPSKWSADLIVSIFTGQAINPWELFLLLSTTIAVSLCGYLVFDTCFYKNWSELNSQNALVNIRHTHLERSFVRMLFPFNSPLRALVFKDLHTLLRDPSQCVQLTILLGLTLVYLYNFRALNDIPTQTPDVYSWWQTLLCITNISMGGCIVATIATRFIYPTVSLEGRSYWTIRCAPISIAQYLTNKFKSLIIPILIVALILFTSGGMAIQLPLEAILLSALSAVALSISIVGLGVGIGASYAKFDWETPTELTSNLGSLVYSIISFSLIFSSLIPIGFLALLICVPQLKELANPTIIIIIKTVCYFSLFSFNIFAARKALKIGATSLETLEL